MFIQHDFESLLNSQNAKIVHKSNKLVIQPTALWSDTLPWETILCYRSIMDLLLVSPSKCASVFIRMYCQDALRPGSISFSFILTCYIELYVSIQEKNPLLLCSSCVFGNVLNIGFRSIVSINVSSCLPERESFMSCMFVTCLFWITCKEVKFLLLIIEFTCSIRALFT